MVQPSIWFREHRGPGEEALIAIREVQISTRTQYQLVQICDLETYGRTLLLDNKIQSAAADEFIYHEALVHPALITLPSRSRIFIAGGAEGATLREVLRYADVERVLMVDIDAELVALCKRELPEWHSGAFDDPRVELHHEDARAYLQRTDERFDAIVIDLSDPLVGGPSALLFTVEFYRLCAERLTAHGIAVTQAEAATFAYFEVFAAIAKSMAAAFPLVHPYTTYIPSYGQDWGFVLGSNHPDPLSLSQEDVDRRLAAAGISALRYYDGATHVRFFHLPKFLRKTLQASGRPITDAEPMYVE